MFLKGFRDANVFLREHPWPVEHYWSNLRSDPRRKRSKRWADSCRPSLSTADDENGSSEEGGHEDDNDNNANGYNDNVDDSQAGDAASANATSSRQRSRRAATPGPDNFVWTETIKQSFREQLEKLVILDYIMRNTDRGLDNWMIKVDWETEQVTLVSEPIQMPLVPDNEDNDYDDHGDAHGPRLVDTSLAGGTETPKTAALPYRIQRPMNASTSLSGTSRRDPAITVGAIDNSLSWPWKHPDAWRRYGFSVHSS